MIALAGQDRFSIVTIIGGGTGADTPAPAWETMFGWPASGVHTLPLDVTSLGDRNIWAARLDEIVRGADRAVLLVADGLGCAASAWWARLSPADYVARIAGAVLFTPEADAENRDRAGLFDSPQTRLPFPSLVIQPGGSATGAMRDTVADWGSRLVVSDRERQRDTGLVAWRQAQRLFLRLTNQVVEHEVGRAEALAGRR
ncbi:alpha/beta hydrolase [Sphingomonas mollis]|uniref:Alpha/beta hydrolase n=1 Tax=Sphingomonas mollis TaxID=2795726 RepID=A0ABS0XS15_9SPHN|nr:alpha/beta hydrolase [Sphingomonas sp. BT553]MBJ6122826.1 alpha/beta hydrolase [Sphingomonas sp. BT553]